MSDSAVASPFADSVRGCGLMDAVEVTARFDPGGELVAEHRRHSIGPQDRK
jgi:hypothetical protein